MCITHSYTNNYYYHIKLCSSSQQRKKILGQRKGNPQLYYNPKLFLEPIGAKHLHHCEIASTPNRISAAEVEVIPQPQRLSSPSIVNATSTSESIPNSSTITRPPRNYCSANGLPPMDNSSAATHSSNAKATSVLEFSSSTSPILDQSTKSLPEVNIQNDSTSKVSTSSCVDNSTNSTNGSSVLNNLGSCGNLTKTAHSPLHDTTLDQMATGTEPTITQTSPLPMLTSPKANPSTPTSQPPSASPSTAQSESDIDLEFEKPDIGCIIDHSELPPLLHAILPKQYTYLFQNVQISKDEECGLVCSADILTNVVSLYSGSLTLKSRLKLHSE